MFEYNEKMVEETAKWFHSMIAEARGVESIVDWDSGDADDQEYWRIKARRLLNHLSKCC